MSYPNRNNSEPLTSIGTWSLIATATFACCAAVVSCKRYREGKKNGFTPGWKPGLPLPISSREHLSGLHIISKSGSDITYRTGLQEECEKWSPKKEFIPLRG